MCEHGLLLASAGRSPNLAALDALACTTDMLARYCAPLLSAQKTVNLHPHMLKLRAFSKDSVRLLKNIADCRVRSTHCRTFSRADASMLR
jgi:hypothetical protein